MGLFDAITSVFKRAASTPGKSQRLSFDKELDERYESYSDPEIASQYSPADLKDFLDLYSNHPWVFVCAHAIASAAASVQWQILKDGSETKEDERSNFLVKPNRFDTWFDLMEMTFLHLELCGNAFWEIVRSKDGKNILAIYPLQPHRIRIVPHPKDKVEKYLYRVNAKELPLLTKDVLHMKYPNPGDEHWGVAPVFSAKQDITLDFWITSWNKKFFKDGAIPGGIIKVPGSLSDPVWSRLKATWNKFHQGVDKSHAIAVLEEGASYEPISLKHADMQYKDQKIYSREVVLSTMRVPPVMIGLTEGVSYATSREQKKIFYQDNIIPKLFRLEAAIDTFLMPEDIQFKFVTRSIDSLVEDDQVKSDIANKNVTHGIMTINEVREKYYGLPPVEWGGGYWVPMGLTYVEKGVPLNRPGAPDPDGGSNRPAINSGEDAGLASPSQVPKLTSRKHYERIHPNEVDMDRYELEKLEAVDPDWDDPVAVHNWRQWTFWKASAGPDDRLIRGKMNAFFKDQLDRLKAKVEAKWKIREPKKPDVKKAEGDEDIEMSDYFDIREEDAKLKAVLVPFAERMLRKYGDLLLGELDVRAGFRTSNPRVEKFLETYGGTRIRNINETTASLAQSHLVEAAKAGEDFKQVISRLADGFEGEGGISATRARRIARTEIVTLTNTARYEAAVQSGVVQQKRWICELLDTSRQEAKGANHVELHNKVVPLDEKFMAKNRSGGFDEMDAPGDISASAENACG